MYIRLTLQTSCLAGFCTMYDVRTLGDIKFDSSGFAIMFMPRVPYLGRKGAENTIIIQYKPLKEFYIGLK